MCSEVSPEGVLCDMEWTHRFTHGNMKAAVFWKSPRPQSASALRAAKMKEIKRAVQSSQD